jgi:hypothetical protein
MAFEKVKTWNGIVDTGELIGGLNKLKNLINFWIERLSKAGSLTSDTEEQRLRKAVLIFLAVIYTIAGIVWGFGYLLLGLPVSGTIPLSYSFISAISLLYFFKTKHYKFFCRSQLTLILILPFLLQWSLGGLTASGAVVLWSILSPIGALMFAGTTRSIPWFIAYLLLMVISGLQTGGSSWQQGTLPNTLVVFSFVMNIGGVSAIVFVLLRYFVHAREQAMAALDKEHLHWLWRSSKICCQKQIRKLTGWISPETVSTAMKPGAIITIFWKSEPPAREKSAWSSEMSRTTAFHRLC